MEISVEQRLTGRGMRDDILRRHGSRKALEAAADQGDLPAQDDLATLLLLEERPERLDDVFEVRDVSRLTVEDMARFSEPGLRVLDALAVGRTTPELARALRLEPGVLKDHIQSLMDMGLVVRVPGRRAALMALPGLDIHITTPPRPAEATQASA